MNLYLLIAIALGAITGITESPVIGPSVILTLSEAKGKDLKMRSARQRSFAVYAAQDDSGLADHERPLSLAPLALTRSDRPLTGAATPRAPAPIR